MINFRKVIHPGMVKLAYRERAVPVFCEIEYKDGKLSISGAINPTSNGDALSCGQIDMEFARQDPARNDKRYTAPLRPEDFTFSPGWDAPTWYKFLDVWDAWHLNDMRPTCPHQTAAGWLDLAKKEVTLYHFRLALEVSRRQDKIKEAAIEALRHGETVTPTPEEAHILSLPYSLTLPDQNAPMEYEPARPLYQGATGPTEIKTLGWLRPEEHPEGLLCRPCPECGYKYGSAWNTEAVPEDVLTFLVSLPDTIRQPAWV